MSFKEFVDRTAPAGEEARRFDNSERTLPDHPVPPAPEQAREIADTARDIAVEIGARFDAQYAQIGDRVSAIVAEMNAYWQAPTPWGMLPTPPPVALFQQWFAALQEMRSLCRNYEVDAEKLARAGVPQFKAYLKQFIDDADRAIETLKKTNTSALSSSPANFGAPPGPMPGSGVAPAPTAMTPAWLMPPMHGMGGPGMGGPPMMGPGMPPGFFPDPMAGYMASGGYAVPPPFGGMSPPGPMTPPMPAMGSAAPPVASGPGRPSQAEPWREEFAANERRMKEERDRRDVQHEGFIRQIKS